MKVFNRILVVLLAVLFFTACKKDSKTGIAEGELLSASTGYCSPCSLNGIFIADSTLTSDNFIDVQFKATSTGTFTIKSDTINGYSFYKSGEVTAGLNTIRLYAAGKPIAAGKNTFTITYGNSKIKMDVTVFGSYPGSAIYDLGSPTGNCTAFTSTGIYKAGIHLDATNTVTFAVNVLLSGTYEITTTTIDGIIFSASGSFANTGVQGVTLTGTGIPATGGSYQFSIAGFGGSCNFPITVQDGAPAVYMLGGNPGSCTGVLLNGTYKVGNILTTANTATVDVNVISPGTYTVTTNTQNGVSFSATGNFLIAGAQQVTLKANGTPLFAGSFPYIINGASTTCSFPVVFNAAAAPPTAFTISCAGATLNGNYYQNIPVTAVNTVVLQANVTTLGTYSITTTTVNGLSFKANGTFTVLGVQPVTLTATGTPTVTGNANITVNSGGGCTFSVNILGTPPAVFNYNCAGITVNGNYYLGSVLGSGNTITAAINVTSSGSYNITTPTVNGITFSSAGVFYPPYPTSVTLKASGTPTVLGANAFTLGPAACPFLVNVSPAVPGIFTCKIDGVFTTFNVNAAAHLIEHAFGGLQSAFLIGGSEISGGNFIRLQVVRNAGGPVPAGTYNQDTYLAHLFGVDFEYRIVNPSGDWVVSDMGLSQFPYTVTITTLTDTRCIGTFNGVFKDIASSNTKAVTEGVFDVPVQ